MVLCRADPGEAGGYQFEHNVSAGTNIAYEEANLFSYFFSSNSAVDGCAKRREPGYEHMEWLRIQLQILRDRGMKAILIGHVPPARVDSKESWDETCWQKYALFGRQFRDVIVGSVYGHMNIDHFMLQDFEHIEKDTENGRMADGGRPEAMENGIQLLEDGEVTVASASDYLLNLREAWAQLPAPPAKANKKSRLKDFNGEDEGLWAWLMSKVSKNKKDGKEERRRYLEKIGGRYAERYAVTHVAPSVVPNYFPTLRIIEYNITGLEHLGVASSANSPPTINPLAQQLPITETDYLDDEEYTREVKVMLRKHKGKKDKKGPKKYKFKVPDGPSKSAPPGPAYSPQTLTWTRYVQYFANLTYINNDFVETPPEVVDGAVLSPNDMSTNTIFGLEVSLDGQIVGKKWKEGKHKKHQGKRPKAEPHPNEFVFEVEYDTSKDKGFADLTVRRWVEYARKIGSAGSKESDVEVPDEEEEEEEVDEEELEGDEDWVLVSKKGGKKHKHKKGKHHKKHKASKEWFTFVKRAFVGTMDPHEIKEVFGGSASSTEETKEAQEVVEL
jgi:endopolyphosphatase